MTANITITGAAATGARSVTVTNGDGSTATGAGVFTVNAQANPQSANAEDSLGEAYADTGDRDKAMAAGCDDYDTKPVELPRLLEKIEALLGRSGMAG